MSYDAAVLADSLAPSGDRLLTMQVTFPRFILAEVNTHRMFSRNSASSRAIPPEKQIERLLAEPFVPEAFHARTPGMGQGEAIAEQERAQETWLNACHQAVTHAELLMEMGISKAHVNRILEPFMWHTAIITATEWDNFFALRCPPGLEVDYDFPAQPEFQRLALCMRKAGRESESTSLEVGQWHLPLVHPSEPMTDPSRDPDDWPLISAGRCARVSFDTHGETELPSKSYARGLTLLQNGHLSPLEHPATPGETTCFYQNLRGWKSLRHQVPHQDNLIGHNGGLEPWDAD